MSRSSRQDWLSSRGQPRRRPTRRRPIHRRHSLIASSRRLRFEQLEDRRLLSITVDTLMDENNGVGVGAGTSLREAIFAAGAGTVIDFAMSLTSGGPATMSLALGELLINKNLTIHGPGDDQLTIDASGSDPTPASTRDDGDNLNDGDGIRLFNIDDGSGLVLDVELIGLKLTGGDISGAGGAIENMENLKLSGSTISGNSARAGGGIGSIGSLTVIGCTISGNSVSVGGGGIQSSGNLTVLNSTINDNFAVTGGGIYAQGNSRVAECTIAGNSAAHGGGIKSSGNMTVSDSLISGNSAIVQGGGILSYEELNVSGSNISGNSATDGEGGGISAEGISMLTNSTVINNTANSYGGGIWSNGSLAVIGSTISGNMATLDGGGIWSDGSVTVSGSTISGNHSDFRGGGIWSDGSMTVMSDSTISGNVAKQFGGGIRSNGNLTVIGSEISGNSTTDRNGGGIRSYGSLAVINATISGNLAPIGSGGGIHASGQLSVTDSTLSGNMAILGGGIYSINQSNLEVRNSTISGNSANRGGGIFSSYSFLTIVNSTISNNLVSGYGGGIQHTGVAAVLDHTIVAKNFYSSTENDDIHGPVVAHFSLFGVDTSAIITDKGGNLIGTAAAPIDPQLDSLADNGGPTKSHALLMGSPAIDAGDPSAISGAGVVPLFDQRGGPMVRVFDGDGSSGARIDIGAYELQPVGPAPPGDYNHNNRVDAADYTVWRNSLGTGGLAPYSGADGDGDGAIGPEDYGVWKSHYGESLPGAGSGGASGGIDKEIGRQEDKEIGRQEDKEIADAQSVAATFDDGVALVSANAVAVGGSADFGELPSTGSGSELVEDSRAGASPSRWRVASVVRDSPRDDALVAWLAESAGAGRHNRWNADFDNIEDSTGGLRTSASSVEARAQSSRASGTELDGGLRDRPLLGSLDVVFESIGGGVGSV